MAEKCLICQPTFLLNCSEGCVEKKDLEHEDRRPRMKEPGNEAPTRCRECKISTANTEKHQLFAMTGEQFQVNY